MSGSSYDLMVHLSFSALGLQAAAGAAIGIFERLQTSALAATGTMTGLQTAMRSLMFAGGVLTGGALLGGGAIAVFVSQASTMQQALVKLGNTSGATREQLAALQQTAVQVGQHTQMNAAQVVSIAQIAARSGVNNPTLLNRVLPTLTNTAMIDAKERGLAPQQSVAATVQLAHQFGAFSGAGMHPVDPYTNRRTDVASAFDKLADLFTRSSMVSGVNPVDMAHRLTYLQPAAAAYHLSPRALISLATTAENVGMSRSGGTLAAVFAGLAPSLLHGGHNLHNTFMNDLLTRGGTTWGKIAAGGDQMIPELMQALRHARATMTGPDAGAVFLGEENSAFGRAGARALGVLSTDSGMARYQQVNTLLGDPSGYRPGQQNAMLPSSAVMGANLNNTLGGQVDQLRANLGTLAQLMGTPMLSPLTALVGGIARVVAGLTTFAAQHPAIARFAATFLLVSTAIAAVAGPLLMVGGAVGLFMTALTPAVGGVVALTGAVLGLDLSMLPVTLVVFAVVAAIALAVTIFLNWHAIVQTVGSALTRFGGVLGSLASGAISGLRNAVLGLVSGAFGLLNGAITWLNTHIPLASQVIALMISPITTIIGAFGHWHQAVTLVQQVFETLQGPFRVVQTFISNMTTGIEGLVSQFGQLVQHVLQLASGPAGQVINALGQAWSAASSAAQSFGSTVGTTVQQASIPGAQTLHPVHDPLPQPHALHHHLATHPITAHHTAAHQTTHHETHHHAVSHQQHIHSGAIHVTVNGAGLDTGGATASATAAALHALRRATTHEVQHGTVRSRGGTPHLRTPVPHR